MSEQHTRKSAQDFPPEVIRLFDQYVHGQMSKRDFLGAAARYATAGLSAAMILEALQPNYALAQQVAEDDPAIETKRITYRSPAGHGAINALMAKPAGATEKLPAVLVVHENRGLNPYIEDVVRRVANAGYLALGPDGLSPLGGYPGSDEQGREMQRTLDRGKLLQDFYAGFEFLRDHEESTGRTGAVGFCYGGGVCNMLAVTYPEMAVSVPYYGRQAPLDEVANIRTALVLHYGETDDRINAGWPEYEQALKASNIDYEAFIYPGVGHAFHNDTTPRYDRDAAELSWRRTLVAFEKYLIARA